MIDLSDFFKEENVQVLPEENFDLSEMIHYFKIEITPTRGNPDISKLDKSSSELFHVQFVQVLRDGSKKIDFRSHASIFDWMHIFLPILLILFVLNCTEPVAKEE